MFDPSKLAPVIAINADSPEWMQAGKRAFHLYLTAPAYIPGATSPEDFAKHVTLAGKAN